MSDKTPSLQDLTKLVMFSGRLSSVHIKNLEAFPFIYFNDLNEAKLDYSIETTDKKQPTTFSYNLALALESNDHLDKRYKALETAVRALFWKEVKVSITINGLEVYKSE